MLLAMLGGCSGHPTSMQDVTSYCRSLSTEPDCDSQSSICAQYSEITLHPYKSAEECRQACEEVRQNSLRATGMLSCQPVYQSVEGKCNEFCNSNYE